VQIRFYTGRGDQQHTSHCETYGPASCIGGGLISPIVEIFQVPSGPKVRQFHAAYIRRLSCSGFGHCKRAVLVEAEHLQREKEMVVLQETTTMSKRQSDPTLAKSANRQRNPALESVGYFARIVGFRGLNR